MHNVGLLSNRVKKVPSTQVDETRYSYLSLEQSEPDLGVPEENGNFLLSTTSGNRKWSSRISYNDQERSLVVHDAYAIRGSSELVNSIDDSTTEVVISTFSVVKYGSAKLTVQVYDLDSGERQSSELLIVHNSIFPTATEYAIVYTGATPLATFDVDMDSSELIVKATGTSPNTLEYKVVETLLLY